MFVYLNLCKNLDNIPKLPDREFDDPLDFSKLSLCILETP